MQQRNRLGAPGCVSSVSGEGCRAEFDLGAARWVREEREREKESSLIDYYCMGSGYDKGLVKRLSLLPPSVTTPYKQVDDERQRRASFGSANSTTCGARYDDMTM
jgi:hypothetical protein